MGEFSVDWLSSREPADRRARADHLLAPLLPRARRRAPHRVLDLGAGSGANLRHLAPRLGPGQRWHCIDHDAGLLQALTETTVEWALAEGGRATADSGRLVLIGPDWDAVVETHAADLADGVPRAWLTGMSLVTASALLDLVSESWLNGLIACAWETDCNLLFALSYDGRAELRPAHPLDPDLIGWVNRHQRRDKGLGSALGPDAARIAARRARAVGYRVRSAASDWLIGPGEQRLQQGLVDGWLRAALEAEPGASSQLWAWHAARSAEIEAAGLTLRVGHQDLVAYRP